MNWRDALRGMGSHRFARFLAVGVLNTAFGYGCYALLLYLGLHYSLALFLSTVAGILFNFKSTGALVFGSHDNRLVLRFFASYAVVYACNVVAIRALLAMGLSAWLAGAVMLLPMAFLAYFLNLKFVFRTP